VLFPVQVAADGPPHVLEIRHVVTQFGDVDGHVVHLLDHHVHIVGHLAGDALHLDHAVDGRLHHVGLTEHVAHLVFLVLLVHLLGDALHADLEGD
jgi:hypothetical protein